MPKTAENMAVDFQIGHENQGRMVLASQISAAAALAAGKGLHISMAVRGATAH